MAAPRSGRRHCPEPLRAPGQRPRPSALRLVHEMADMLSAVVDGEIVLSKALGQPRHLPEQILLYRAFVRLVFFGP